MHARPAAPSRYAERLGCPASWWAAPLAIGLSSPTRSDAEATGEA